MTEKIIVIPESVRGYGNIVEEKDIDDFDKYLSNLASTTETVNNESVKVYTLSLSGYSLRLTLDASNVSFGTDVLCSAVLTDDESSAVSGASISFESGGVSVGTGTTDSTGLAEFTLEDLDAGTYSIQAEYDTEGVSSTVITLTVTKLIPSITFSGSVSGSTVSVSGVLSIGSGYSIDIYQDGVVVDTVTTTSNGAFSSTLSNVEGGIHEYYAMFNGVTNYTAVTSSKINLSVEVAPVLTLTVTGSSFSSYNSSPFTYSDTVVIDYGDGTLETYTGGQISHTYDTSGTYTVNVYGEVTALNDYCFRSVTNITSAIIGDSVTSLGNQCFWGCTGLTSIDLGNSVTTLGGSCFSRCTGLTSVTLPDSVTSLGTYCFGTCTGLTSVTLPDSVITLGGSCFSDCTGLTSIDLGNSVTTLGGQCFAYCTGLTSLAIPSSVTSIGKQCFSGSTNLTLLYLYWTTSDYIITYNTSTWLRGASVSSFSIPTGTTSLYTAKDYPSSMLVERGGTSVVTSVSLSASSQSITTAESSTLTATVYDQNGDVMANQSVEFFDGETSLGTDTTNSNGVATLSFTGTQGTHTVSSSCSSIDSNSVTITVTEVPTVTSVGLTTSSGTITVLETATLTATVTDQNGDPMENEIVTFYNGATSLGTDTTDSSGIATYTFSEDSGTYTLKATCDGVDSSTVSVTVNLITTTLTIATSSVSVEQGDTFTLSGVLSAGTGKSIEIYENGTLKDTVTSTTDGEYSSTITASTIGSNTYYALFGGDSTYAEVTSANVTVTVTQPSVASVVLTGTSTGSSNSILSEADGDVLTLSATAYDSNSQPVSGKTIEFFNGSTSMGTATTNSSGVATCNTTYTSQGSGDITFTATELSSSSSSTYNVEDCFYYDTQTVDKQRYTVTTGGATISYSSDGVTITGTQSTDSLVKNTALTLPNSYSAEVTLTKLSGYTAGGETQYGGLCFDNCLIDMTSARMVVYTLSPIASLTTINQGANQGDVLKIEYDNGTMKIYINDVLKTTQSITHTGIHQHRSYKFPNDVGKSITAKDLKIKPL